MKSKVGMIVAALAFVVLVTLGYYLYNNRVVPSQPCDEVEIDPGRGPASLSDSPLNFGEEVTFEEAQARTDYHIPLPKGISIQRVWISNYQVESQEGLKVRQSTAIQFDKDLELIIHQEDSPPNWGGIVAQSNGFRKVNVKGIPGMGADPGVKIFDCEVYPYPGSVSWWVDGLKLTLYSDTLSLEVLLMVTETLE